MKNYKQHYEESVVIPANAVMLFAYLDDHSRLSSHMSKSSWMMGGGKMENFLDEGRGQKVGSHIRLTGRAFGIKIFLDEVITHYQPALQKAWETVGDLKLLVIGYYKMKFEIKPKNSESVLQVSIDYDLPQTNIWLGYIFGKSYAKWCVRRILKDAHGYFVERGYN